MKRYLYLPYKKCKNCKHFDGSCAKAYTCIDSEDCPAIKVGIVVKDSVIDLANQYKEALASSNIDKISNILSKVNASGKAFVYKFKLEIKK